MRRIVSAIVIAAFALGLLSPSPASAADHADIAKELERQLTESGSLAVRPSTQREFYLTFTPQAEIDRLTAVWPLETWVRKFREEKAAYYAPIFLVISDLQPEFNADATRATFRWNAVPDAPPGSSISVAGTITLMRVDKRWYISDRVSDDDLENYRRIAKLSPEDEQALAKLIDESVRLLRAKNDVEYIKLTTIPSFLQTTMNSPGGLEQMAKQLRAMGGDYKLKTYEALQGKKLYGYELDKLAGLEGTDATGQGYGMFFVKIDGRWYENIGGLKVPNLAGAQPGLAMPGAAGATPPTGLPQTTPPSIASIPSTAFPSTTTPSTAIPTTPRPGYDPRSGRPGQSGLSSTGRPAGIGRDGMPGRDNIPGREGLSGRDTGIGRDPTSRFAPGGVGVGRPSGTRPTNILPPTTTPRTDTSRTETPRPETTRPESTRTEKPLPADTPKVDDLPFPLVKGTVEFKKQSNRIEYESTADVDAVADAISDALARAGWQTTGRDLGKQTRIMKRSRGEATLSYMIHPQSKGSRISIGTRGLDWSAK